MFLAVLCRTSHPHFPFSKSLHLQPVDRAEWLQMPQRFSHAAQVEGHGAIHPLAIDALAQHISKAAGQGYLLLGQDWDQSPVWDECGCRSFSLPIVSPHQFDGHLKRAFISSWPSITSRSSITALAWS